MRARLVATIGCRVRIDPKTSYVFTDATVTWGASENRNCVELCKAGFKSQTNTNVYGFTSRSIVKA
jgi:hypothetical protein